MNLRKVLKENSLRSKLHTESVTHYAKADSAITLIALVITIIVLLILAGVSLNLVAGGDGILQKAENAVEETNKAKIKEEVELALSELKTEYYEARYVAKTTTDEFGPYAANKLSATDGEGNIVGISTSTGKIILKNDTIIYKNDDGVSEPTGKLNQTTGEITIFGETFASKITTANYGDYVDLGTTLLPRNNEGVISQKLGGETPTEQPLSDWRIFHKDEDGGIYLILADYLPYEYETSAVAGSSTGLGTGLSNQGSSHPYNWKSDTDRTDLIDRLNDKTTWSKLLSPTYTAKGITVTGALDLEKWVEGWNANNSTQLNTQYTTDTKTYNAEGWLVGDTNPPTEYYCGLSSDTGYGNTLYFPHQEEVSNNWGYWLASPSASYASRMMRVSCDGYVYYTNYGNVDYGVRPAVFLPAGIDAEKNAEGIWELEI